MYHGPNFLSRGATVDVRKKSLPGFPFGSFYCASSFDTADLVLMRMAWYLISVRPKKWSFTDHIPVSFLPPPLEGIERVQTAKLLGVVFQGSFMFYYAC